MKLKLLAGAVLAALALSVSAATPAMASTPVTKVQALKMFGWNGMSVKPADFYFGNGGAPYITNVKWNYWRNGANAYAATATLYQQANPNCSPSYKCPYTHEHATVYLYTVKVHGSLHYFYNMSIRYRLNHHDRHAVLEYKAAGWNFPAAPYPF
jgi:hypothetical protein